MVSPAFSAFVLILNVELLQLVQKSFARLVFNDSVRKARFCLFFTPEEFYMFWFLTGKICMIY